MTSRLRGEDPPRHKTGLCRMTPLGDPFVHPLDKARLASLAPSPDPCRLTGDAPGLTRLRLSMAGRPGILVCSGAMLGCRELGCRGARRLLAHVRRRKAVRGPRRATRCQRPS